MVLNKQSILAKTYFGINIYAFVLRQYYPNKTVLSLSGKDCLPTNNPFNNNSNSLIISIDNNIAYHKDLEKVIPDGDSFDFAKLHFKKDGIELLETINKVLGLNIGTNQQFYNQLPILNKPETAKIIMPKFSIFKYPITNIIPEKIVNLNYVYNLIRHNHYECQTNKLRTITDIKAARKYKASNFYYVTFSGTFSKRSDNLLINHSGLLTVDFDHISNLSNLRNSLLVDEYFETELLFTSPSGDGLKWVIPIDLSQGTHKENFLAISNYIKATYNIEVDSSGKDISRACFLPYDNEAYINPKYI